MKSLGWWKSLTHAWEGIRFAFKRERNFRIQSIVALVLIILVFSLPLAAWERVALLTMCAFVLVLELLNTSIEHLVDFVKPRLDPYAKDIKDVMAGAVLLVSLFAVMIGAVILWPYLVGLL